MLTFEHFYLCTSRDEFSAKPSDERNDRLAILLILRFVGNGSLNNKICRHNRFIFRAARECCKRSGPAVRCPRNRCAICVKARKAHWEHSKCNIPRIRFTGLASVFLATPLKPSAAIALAISIAFFSLVYPRRLGWQTAICSRLCRAHSPAAISPNAITFLPWSSKRFTSSNERLMAACEIRSERVRGIRWKVWVT
jgi:hypothetical protein